MDALDDQSKLRALLDAALDKLAPSLSEEDAGDVRDYVEHGEYGPAWELLWHIVQEDALDAPASLVEAGRAMGFDA